VTDERLMATATIQEGEGATTEVHKIIIYTMGKVQVGDHPLSAQAKPP
jgi:hypothetical protein